ncbi:MAG TPA: TlpA disulfide reductase family protein, partial [Salinimicrobium sp.]|nr:TlpA disulfide reductase family protein [Salinimicrobium sp.]
VEQNQQKYLDLLKSFQQIDTGFVSLEKKALDYKNRMTRELYVLYNEKGYYRPGEDGKAPSYEAILADEIELDNAEDYELYDDYRQLVSLNFYKKTSLLNPEDSASFTERAFRYIENVESENIKNDLLDQVAYRIRPGGENNEEIYNRIMAAASEEVFKKELTEKFETIKKLDKGNPSPTFTYENHKGGETSLDSLQGKYVYIDVWATWCGPCLREIPDLKKLEDEYKGENIHFVSLSIDTEEDYDKWKKMVTEKELGGIQVIADNAWNSEFIQNYAINGIPRFILLDPQGKIVSADAPRPSNPELKELFKSLEI